MSAKQANPLPVCTDNHLQPLVNRIKSVQDLKALT